MQCKNALRTSGHAVNLYYGAEQRGVLNWDVAKINSLSAGDSMSHSEPLWGC